MEKGLLDLHSLLRWAIILLLLITILFALARKQSIRSSSLWLLICAHTTLLIGLYQLIFSGRYAMLKGLPPGTELMKSAVYRFYWVEHPLMMIIAIVLITVARGKAKALNYKATGWLLFIALIVILAAVPWPFREVGSGRYWFPHM
jgi:uncharacterized membrane protein